MTLRVGKKINFPAKGFSLIELLTVCIIIGIIAATSMTYFNGMIPKHGLDGAARDISTAIRTTRNHAITNNRNFTFNFFDVASGKYRIDDSHATITLDKVYSLPKGVNITSPVAPFTITFKSTGSVSGSNPATITLANQRGDTKSITVINVTGRVKIS